MNQAVAVPMLLQISRPSVAGGLFIVAAGSTLLEDPTPSVADDPSPTAPPASSDAAVAQLERIMSAPSANTSSTSASKPAGSKRVVDDNENLKSTFEHRAWTFGCMSLMTASLIGGLGDVHSISDAGTAAGAVLSAYVLSDLGTAVYHWAVDNYGDGNTPLVGKQIAAFQGHHQRPWTITQREFCNNVHQVGCYSNSCRSI
jgi:ubiquitin-conjugating enzyme E2 variant